ncbi:MAG: hypothetical protein K2N63_02925 [Lachnospiraceae bacterium]|nr:hypothetical protein [Lachnospiraceae bacterium]
MPIENPFTYLRGREPEKNYTLSSFSPPFDFDGYVINDRNACAVYAVAAVITHHLKPVDGIDFATRLGQCKEIALSKGYGRAENYYLNILKYKPFSKDCLALYDTVLRPDSDLFFPWKSACRQINAKFPVLINIWREAGSGYHDHTVVAYGWCVYTDDTQKEHRFYKVRDGYNAGAARYVDVERLGLYYITKIFSV